LAQQSVAAQQGNQAHHQRGSGPRVCIGSGFAMMEAQLLLATLTQQLRFQLVAGQQVGPANGPTMRARGDIKLRVQRRTELVKMSGRL